MTYGVEITDAALDAIRTQARYIAIDCHAPLNAARWLEKICDAAEGLEHLPARHNLAEESAYKSYEVRRVLVGDYLILFTIDEPAHKVWIIGFPHGNRLPRPNDLTWDPKPNPGPPPE